MDILERVARAICVSNPDELVPTFKVTKSEDGRTGNISHDYSNKRPAWKDEEYKAKRAIAAVMDGLKEAING